MAKRSGAKKTQLEINWDKLKPETRDLYVTLLWSEGYTEQAIANFLKTTKGRVVVHRQRVLKLSSEGRTLKRSAITRENLRDLLDIAKLDEAKAHGIEQTSDIWDNDIPETKASAESIESAAEEGVVVPLRKPRSRRKTKTAESAPIPEKPAQEETSADSPKTAEPEVPSAMDLPFLPPLDIQEPETESETEEASATEVIPESKEIPVKPEPPEETKPRFVAEEVTHCQYPNASGMPCGKPVRPGSHLCEEHFELAMKSRSL